MRIMAIRGQNLAALSGEFKVELDRPPLSSLGLFAIHGPVGAGKSTLLDALTLALYGRTPRLTGQGGAPIGDDDEGALRTNDPRTLVRRGAALAYAEVDFSALDGRVYRARWEVKRGTRNKTKLQPEKQTLLDVVNGERVGDSNSDVRKHVERLLGLSFDELCRSVLLAQGGFQGFLHAKPSERGELLEKVTGTALYSRLSVRAHEKGKALRDEEQQLLTQRAALHVLDDDERKQKEQEAVRSSVEAHAAEDEATRLNRLLDQARAHKAQVRAAGHAQAEHQKAQKAAQAAEERAQRTQEALAAVSRRHAAAQPLLERARALDASIALAATSSAPAAHDKAKQEAQEAHAHVVTLAHSLRAIEQRIEKAEGAGAEFSGFVDVRDAVCSGLLRLERARTDVEGTQAVVASVARAHEEAHAAVVVAEEAWRRAAPVIPDALVGEDLGAVLARALQRRLDVDDAALREARGELVVEKKVRDRLVRSLSKAQERALLEDGEPCPLCGSTEHPFASSAPAHAAVVDVERRIAELAQQEQQLVDGLARGRARLASLPQDVASTVDFDDVDALEQLYAQREESKRGLRVLDDLRQRAVHAARDLAFQQEAAAAKAAVVVDVEAQLVGLGLGDADLAQPKKRAKQIAEGVDKLLAARAALARDRDEQQAVTTSLSEAQARARVADETLALRAREHAEHEAALRALKAERRAVLDDDVTTHAHALQAQKQDAETAWQEAQTEKQKQTAALASAAAVLRERSAIAEGSDVDVDGVAEEAAAAKARAVSARESHALLRAALAHDAQLVERARVLDDKIAEHRAASRVWWELAHVIGSSDGSRFRHFAQSLTLNALVVHANEQLMTLAPRYRLQRVAVTQARHDLDLVVVDTEAGDEVRSTATLSGGESFLVSLALALGLSSLSANEGARGRVESLFIDEGFSALDAETLDVALSAFDALRQTGRQIGVISHVPLLVERIGAQVRVIPVGGGASRVEVRAG